MKVSGANSTDMGPYPTAVYRAVHESRYQTAGEQEKVGILRFELRLEGRGKSAKSTLFRIHSHGRQIAPIEERQV